MRCAPPVGNHQHGPTSRSQFNTLSPTPWRNHWQAEDGKHQATAAIHTTGRTELLATLDPASQAMIESQTGPFASRACTTIPSGPEFAYPSDLFRILLLRRLRLPLPLSARYCTCRCTLDSFGDHRAACATSGALRSRPGPLERAAARECREAGAGVTTHVLVSDLNLTGSTTGGLKSSLTGFRCTMGHKLAVDTTMVSPLTSGQPRPQGCQPGSPALRAARKAKERTYPELVRGNRCRLVVLAIEVGGKWGHEAAEFLRLLAQARNRSVPYVLRTAAIQASIARWSAHPCGTSAVCSQPHPTRPSKPEQHRRQHATPEHPPATPPWQPTPNITPPYSTLRGAPLALDL